MCKAYGMTRCDRKERPIEITICIQCLQPLSIAKKHVNLFDTVVILATCSTDLVIFVWMSTTMTQPKPQGMWSILVASMHYDSL